MRKLLFVTLLCLCIGTAAQNKPDGSIITGIDFTNAQLVGSVSLADAIVDYIASCGGSENVSHCRFVAADDIVMSASVNVQMYDYVLRGLIEVFSAFGEYKIVDYLADMPYAPLGEMTDERHESLKGFVDSYRKVKIGEIAPEIEWETIDGQKFVLSELECDCILSFVSLGCDHCKEWLRDIKPFLKQHSDYKLVIWMVNGSDREMKRFLRRNRLGNVLCLSDGMSWKSPVVNEYCVSSTPSNFVMDKNMIIVDKPETIEDLCDFVNNHQK